MKNIFLTLMIGGLMIGCSQNKENAVQTERPEIHTASVIDLPGSSAEVADDQDIWLPSLITATPQEGRELAITMARKTIGAIQKDPEVKKKLRAEYSENAGELILSAQVVATEFQTVAAANNYWRK